MNITQPRTNIHTLNVDIFPTLFFCTRLPRFHLNPNHPSNGRTRTSRYSSPFSPPSASASSGVLKYQHKPIILMVTKLEAIRDGGSVATIGRFVYFAKLLKANGARFGFVLFAMPLYILDWTNMNYVRFSRCYS